MKQVKLLLLLFVMSTASAQDTTAFEYSNVVNVDSVSAEILYSRANNWFAKAYKNPDKVINIRDKENGHIGGSANIKYVPKVFAGSDGIKGVINYNIDLYVKEGRYKILLSSFVHEPYRTNVHPQSFGLITNHVIYPRRKATQSKKWCHKVWLELKKNAQSEIDILTSSLKKSMNIQAPSENDDW